MELVNINANKKISRANNISISPIFVKWQHIRTIPLLMPALCDSGYPFCKLESTCLTMESIQDLLALLFVPTDMRLIFNRLSFKWNWLCDTHFLFKNMHSCEIVLTPCDVAAAVRLSSSYQKCVTVSENSKTFDTWHTFILSQPVGWHIVIDRERSWLPVFSVFFCKILEEIHIGVAIVSVVASLFPWIIEFVFSFWIRVFVCNETNWMVNFDESIELFRSRR